MRPAVGNAMTGTLVHMLLMRLVAAATGDVPLPDQRESGERVERMLHEARSDSMPRAPALRCSPDGFYPTERSFLVESRALHAWASQRLEPDPTKQS